MGGGGGQGGWERRIEAFVKFQKKVVFFLFCFFLGGGVGSGRGGGEGGGRGRGWGRRVGGSGWM